MNPETDMSTPPEVAPPNIVEKIKAWYRALPDKKRYLEFLTALLTIPVLLTVLLNNLSNLQPKKASEPTPTPQIVITQPVTTTAPKLATPTETPTASPTPGPLCVKEVGPVEISYPDDGATVSSDPVCLDIVRPSGNYCSVVWSYRINGGTWSDYTDKSICMYGLTPGVKTLDLQIKSIVSQDTTVLHRTFTVANSMQTPSPTPATSSATLEN